MRQRGALVATANGPFGLVRRRLQAEVGVVSFDAEERPRGGYWKARAYLTACIAIAWKRRAYIHGVYLPGEDVQLLAEGNVLLGWKGEGIWELGHTAWHPEDMALYPEQFLKGIDPERDDFGITSALGLWLVLEKKGLMNAGINANEARKLFEKELAKHTSA